MNRNEEYQALLAELEPYQVAELSRTVVAAPALRAVSAWA